MSLTGVIKCFKRHLWLTAKIQTNQKRRKRTDELHRLSASASSKEESSHPPADALSVVQDVELVDELVHTIAGLGNGA